MNHNQRKVRREMLIKAIRLELDSLTNTDEEYLDIIAKNIAARVPAVISLFERKVKRGSIL